MKNRMRKEPLIQVAMVESDPLRFVGLRALLDCERDLELTSVSMAELAEHETIDVALLRDQSDRNLFNQVDSLKAERPDLRIIVTGQSTDDEMILKAIAAGAKGYINEAAPAAELALAIRIVHRGLVWAPRRVLSMFVDRSSSSLRRDFPIGRLDFTQREKQVLELLVNGRSNKEIAAPLGIEERTVKAHVARLMRKVGVQNRIALSVHAITHALVAAQY
jgi:DNA-binding NarL/FixJ family response regulator